MKIRVCDFCQSEGKLTQTTKGRRLTKTPFEIDFCEGHKKDIPEDIEEFKALVYKFNKI